MNVDWNELHSAFQMNMPEVTCYLSLKDGSVLKLRPGDPIFGEVRSNPSHFLEVETVPSRIQYSWLDDFTKTIGDDDLRKRTEAAINGKGAFRRFKDILARFATQTQRQITRGGKVNFCLGY